MTGSQFEVHRLFLVPLTPIHVGGGEEAKLLPENYRLRNGMVERLNLRSVLTRMSDGEREQWLKNMGRDVQSAIPHIQARADDGDILERIEISPESEEEISSKGQDGLRLNQIDAFFRSAGQPTIPGTSIKGALRTAWAAYCAGKFSTQQRLPDLQEWRNVLTLKQRAQYAARSIEDIFNLKSDQHTQDSDPFRDLSVADVGLPVEATRIDRVKSWKRNRGKRSGEDGYGFSKSGQIHRERLRAVSDGGSPPPILRIEIGLRRTAFRRVNDRKRPDPERVPSDLSVLLRSLEAHHSPLWTREVEEKFFAGSAGQRMRQALALFEHLVRDKKDPDAALIRIGWAGHAEAKSIAQLRRVERPQSKGEGRYAKEGTSRHVVDLKGHPVSFGWALLVREECWKKPAKWLSPPVTVPHPGVKRPLASSGAKAETALGQVLRYQKGQRVRLTDGEIVTLEEDVTEAAKPSDEVQSLLGNDIEPIKISDIEGPA